MLRGQRRQLRFVIVSLISLDTPEPAPGPAAAARPRAAPLLAENTFHGTSTTYSWPIGALGAGAIAGGLYAARSAGTGVARLIRAAVGYAIAVGLVAAAPTPPTAIAACVLAGVASVIFLTTGNATIQLASDPEYRGRVTALWSTALVGSTAIGSPVIGGLSDFANPRYALGLGAAACLAAAVVGGWRGRRPRYDITPGPAGEQGPAQQPMS